MYDNPDGVMIGLEVHVQLNKLKTKVFCGCATDYHNDPPNSHVCPVCLGLPGALPVINKKAVEAAIKIGLALNCNVEEHTQFYRKNYYYPDLPKGFQITQYDFPISSGGYVMIEGEDAELRVGITRAHMEEDPGRLVHEGTIDKSKYTLIDYNRSGMALIEIVSDPDMRSPKEARRYLDKLRNIIEYLDVFDGNLEGAMRVDANISIMGGQRAEIKNISSHKGAERALLFEIVRQKNVLRRGGVVVQETRHFDEAREITLSMRTKEEAHDYRYFPEPDLVPLKIAGWAPAIKETLPELPDARRMRFVEQYGIMDDHAKALTSELRLAEFYEQVAKRTNPKMAAVWICDVLKGELNYRDLTFRVYNKHEPPNCWNLNCNTKMKPEEVRLLSFSWDEVPGKDNNKLIGFLIQNYGSNWVANATIEKIENERTIKIHNEIANILLQLNDDKDEVNLTFTDVATVTYKFPAEIDNNLLNIYEKRFYCPICGASRDQNTIFIVKTRKPETPERILTTEAMINILDFLIKNKISEDGAVEIIRTILERTISKEPKKEEVSDLITEKGLVKIEGDIVETAALEAIKENPTAVADYKSGKEKALNSLVGAVMKKTKGRTDARTVREVLMGKLE